MLAAAQENQTLSQYLATQYYSHSELAQQAANSRPAEFLRLLLTVHGMQPAANWRTHTYVEYFDAMDGQRHFFLSPAQQKADGPNIRVVEDTIWVDDFATDIKLQRIPHTTPFWYFHYDPNRTEQPFYSMTLNLSPACGERCVLCAGAKTGRVNNGMSDTLSPVAVFEKIFLQYPQAKEQLKQLAVVTGCFESYDLLHQHLSEVRTAALRYGQVDEFRVLEHNVVHESQMQAVMNELGYDVFITLECFDQELRNIALNGKVGRKGRNSAEFEQMIVDQARFIEARGDDKRAILPVTYLFGLDDLSVTESFFARLAEVNAKHQVAKIMPWTSIFTPYNNAMNRIQHQDFSLEFLLQCMNLCEKYFGVELMRESSGTTAQGYARGLY